MKQLIMQLVIWLQMVINAMKRYRELWQQTTQGSGIIQTGGESFPKEVTFQLRLEGPEEEWEMDGR